MTKSIVHKEKAILPKALIRKELKEEIPSGGKLLQVFLDQDMRNGHEGLAEVAKRHSGLDVSKLQYGQYLVFVNGAMDRIKMYAAGNVVAYQVLTGGRKVDFRAIREIPRIFQATGKLDYDKALENVIREKFAEKYPRKVRQVSPLDAGRAMKRIND